jgi:hypothetical protein
MVEISGGGKLSALEGMIKMYQSLVGNPEEKI